MLGLPLERTAVDEGSAFGAALLGGVAERTFRDAHEAVAACVRVRETVEPNADWAARLRATDTLAIARCIRQSEEWRTA